MPPDFKKPKRTVDPAALKQALLREQSCVACGYGSQDAHHVLFKGRTAQGDDVSANLVGLCRPCHHKVHQGNPLVLTVVAEYVRASRPDTMEYLDWKLPQGTEEFLGRRYG